jgi:hypothetical protein
MKTIKAKGGVVNKNEVEAQFVGKNLTIVGGMGLFHRFVKKLGMEEALEQSIELSPQASVKYKTGRILILLIYTLVSCLVNTFSLLKAFITAEKLTFALYQSLD